ncbi:D-cysteine desulfhydrase [Sphingomonas oligoaromativorans]|uniref:D-cysteine desulfhydrase n=1 Tax=Sphingomonas oligoaromativorans TaxID=575322 RepID=UPI00141F461C|nr:D-cysteine desulfhydrase [Sphingomonas oligoaromativorans]NIJ32963.1 D-cysteine desulfhydrase [Sphingomonas oligoaromativorans]
MSIARFPRRRYTPGMTAIERLDRLSEALGGPTIWIKRDDQLGLSAGGNKTRKLEFLVADALAQGADTLVTTGAPQSNHCRLTAAAAVKEGLKCRLLIEERIPGSFDSDASGNHFLFDLLGVESIEVVPAGTDLAAGMARIAEGLKAEGRKPYVIPGGGSNPLGALGYVACAGEIVAQSADMGVAFDAVVCASGSAGTHAGLLVGLEAARSQMPLTGVSVRRAVAEQTALVEGLALRTAGLLGHDASVVAGKVAVDDRWVGEGYAIPTDTMIEAVRMLAGREGVLLDPVYTGKAMAGLIGQVREGRWKKGDNILFVHTGGSPALYAYRPALAKGVPLA